MMVRTNNVGEPSIPSTLMKISNLSGIWSMLSGDERRNHFSPTPGIEFSHIGQPIPYPRVSTLGGPSDFPTTSHSLHLIAHLLSTRALPTSYSCSALVNATDAPRGGLSTVANGPNSRKPQSDPLSSPPSSPKTVFVSAAAQRSANYPDSPTETSTPTPPLVHNFRYLQVPAESYHLQVSLVVGNQPELETRPQVTITIQSSSKARQPTLSLPTIIGNQSFASCSTLMTPQVLHPLSGLF